MRRSFSHQRSEQSLMAIGLIYLLGLLLLAGLFYLLGM
jgi:hypothetical protein